MSKTIWLTKLQSYSRNRLISFALWVDGVWMSCGLALRQNVVPTESIGGPGNFGTLQGISPDGLPRVFQFSVRFTF